MSGPRAKKNLKSNVNLVIAAKRLQKKLAATEAEGSGTQQFSLSEGLDHDFEDRNGKQYDDDVNMESDWPETPNEK